MPALSKHDSGYLDDRLPENAVLIIGAGHFGGRAARILTRKSDSLIYVVDKDETSLAGIQDLPVERILYDGVRFLVENLSFLSPSNVIIPALPVHLAFEWLRHCLRKDFIVKQIGVPGSIKPFLPHTWPGSEGSLLVSYADFRCPDDCPEPGDYCTVTGEKRGTPLYKLISQLNPMDFGIHIIRSRQLAPGLGGYKVDNLREMLIKVEAKGTGKWLIGTACKCHGTITGMEICAK
jgi:hypothetical protein